MKLKAITEEDKKILIKILLVKILVLIFLFLVRSPTTMIVDAEIYYNLTKNPAETFKPPTTPITDIGFKPMGWPLFLYSFYKLYPNWIFWALSFNFIFSFLALYLFYKITNEKIMWLFFFYPYFLYHSNFPLEVPIFCFLLTLSFYYLKRKNFLSNLLCNVSSLFRIEGILFSLYILSKKIEIKSFLLFFFFTLFVAYFYGVFYLLLNFNITTRNPSIILQYARIFIPFLIPIFINYKDFFTKHFWKVMILWFIFGLSVGYFKFFYEWNILS